ncbi:nuclease [Rhynchospora pubera]|uniref:Nuclease n=1 Tax=Rhynchospora pubera TaxID=906938 RepID=A0AAV8HH18_9POAL|nr:nuclease [Rhynchospora pubera]
MSSDEERALILLMMKSAQWMCTVMQICMQELMEEDNNSSETAEEWIPGQLEGDPSRCFESYRMSTENFNILCDKLKAKGLACKGDVIVEDQVEMFLQILGHATNIQKISEDFQHSTETVWRCFRDVLHYVRCMDYINLPSSNARVHQKISEGTIHAPFKDALGVIDCTHIPAFPDLDTDSLTRYRNRKRMLSQNVMAAVDFDGNFLTVIAGWEGEADDNRILRRAVENGVIIVPPGKYYLVDRGYANTPQFLGPYRGRPYRWAEFHARHQNQNLYECPEDLFNHRHIQLASIVEETFGILKSRFKILQMMPKYEYKIQVKIVVACCILHNFIKHQNSLRDVSDESSFYVPAEYDIPLGDNVGVGDLRVNNIQTAGNLRDNIRDILWATR